MTNDTDRELFFKSLALFDKDESQLRARVLPADVDIDATVDAAFNMMMGNPSILPM